MENELKLTSATQWRKMREDGVLLELPSGFVGRFRPMSLEALVKRGKIPNQLGTIVAEMIRAGTYVPADDPFGDAKLFIELIEVMIKEVFMYPKIVDEVRDPDNEILFDDVSTRDREWVLMWAQAPQRALANFREEQDGTLEPAPNV